MKYQQKEDILENGEFVLATISNRMWAFIIDLIIIFIIIVMFALLIHSLGITISELKIKNLKTHIQFKNLSTISQNIFNFIFLLIPTIYFTLITYLTNGYTIGKKILKIKIISLYHKKISLWHCFERSLGYVASTLEFGLGFIQAIWSKNRMTVHDKIAETIVIQKVTLNKNHS